jgi:hypothetical protein
MEFVKIALSAVDCDFNVPQNILEEYNEEYNTNLTKYNFDIKIRTYYKLIKFLEEDGCLELYIREIPKNIFDKEYYKIYKTEEGNEDIELFELNDEIDDLKKINKYLINTIQTLIYTDFSIDDKKKLKNIFSENDDIDKLNEKILQKISLP